MLWLENLTRSSLENVKELPLLSDRFEKKLSSENTLDDTLYGRKLEIYC